jgi:hypothetical protein
VGWGWGGKRRGSPQQDAGDTVLIVIFLGNRVWIITILISMQNYSQHLKMLGALHDATWIAGNWAEPLSASLLFFHSFRVLFGTDLDLLNTSDWE